MKKTIAILTSIIMLLLLLICGMLIYLYSTDSAQPTWQEQYDTGIRYLSDGNYQQAVLAFTSAIEISPKRYEAYIGRGDAYMQLGNFEAARQDYRQAIESEPACQPEVAPRLEEAQDSLEGQPDGTLPDETFPEETLPEETLPEDTAQAPVKRITRILTYEDGYPAEKVSYTYNADGLLQGYLHNTDDGFGHDFHEQYTLQYDADGNLTRYDFHSMQEGYTVYRYEAGELAGYTQVFTAGDGIDSDTVFGEYRIERDPGNREITRSSSNADSFMTETVHYLFDAEGRCISSDYESIYNDGSSFSSYKSYDYSYNGFIVSYNNGDTSGQSGVWLIPPCDPVYDLPVGLSCGEACTIEADSEGYIAALRGSNGQLLYGFEYEYTPAAMDTQEKIPFESLPSSFTFSSGAGGWRTELTLRTDGSFEGHFSDSDMGDAGDEYPGGTVYYCDFYGSFTQPQRVSPYIYEMKLMDFRTTASNERIENGIRYIPSDAYGFDGSDTYYLYLPGIPLDSLPEDIRQWVWQSYWIQADNVPNYLICGAENQYPFISNEASFE